MTGAARDGDMSSRDLEFRSRVVVELCPQPLNCVVANRAVLWESCRCVVGILAAVKIGGVAGHASGAERRKLVVCMASLAGDGYVGPAQGKPGLVVIELSPQPLRGVMTGFAALREARRSMVRVFGSVVNRLVAGVTRACQPGIDIFCVT